VKEPVANIEIDIFSGRPNPTVELRGQKAQHLIDLLERKRERLEHYHADTDLGFRGFLVRLGFPGSRTYRVADGVVTKGDDAFYDPHQEAQGYIVSLLPPAMKTLVEPFLGVKLH
jgi:hypothetical protein